MLFRSFKSSTFSVFGPIVQTIFVLFILFFSSPFDFFARLQTLPITACHITAYHTNVQQCAYAYKDARCNTRKRRHTLNNNETPDLENPYLFFRIRCTYAVACRFVPSPPSSFENLFFDVPLWG